MSDWMQSSQAATRDTRGDGLFRRRLMSRSDVKRTQSAGRSQNRQMMRGGRS